MGLESTAFVRKAIRKSAGYAEEKGVPLTAERLASELKMHVETFHKLADPAFVPEDDRWLPGLTLIRAADAQATASVLEHALTRGTGVNVHMMYLKRYAGYEDKTVSESGSPVCFVGENEIQP